MAKAKRPTAAAVRKVLQVYERDVLNPVLAWLRLAGEDEAGEPQWLADDLVMVHRGLRILHDDVQQGLVDWEASGE